jgi:transcriptional regulator with XRE-family HTH domain
MKAGKENHMNRERIIERRRVLGMTASELARAAHVSKGYISEIESGTKSGISAAVGARIAAALDTTIDYLMGGGPLRVDAIRRTAIERVAEEMGWGEGDILLMALRDLCADHRALTGAMSV